MFIAKLKKATTFLAFFLNTGFLAGLVTSVVAEEKKESKKDDPKKDDERVLDSIDGGESVTLEGKSRKLLIKTINGGATVTCGKLEVEEIEIESLNGGASVTLKLADKAKLKKLTIKTINGGARLDAGELEVAQIEFGVVEGGADIKAQASGDIAIKDVLGGAQITIMRCRNFTVGSVRDGASINASYSGEAKVPENNSATLNLKKIDPPK